MKVKIVRFTVFFLSAVLISCGSKGTPEAGNFLDDFSAYSVADPWNPSGGWHYGKESWDSNLKIEETAGNKILKISSTGWSILYNDFNVAGYTVSARIKPYSDSGKKPSFCGIVSFYDESGVKPNFYTVMLFSNGSLQLQKSKNGSGSVLDSNTILYSSTWYTFSLSVNGVQVNATVTDGVNTVNLSGTDSSPFLNGKLGVYFNWNSSVIPDTEFDDIKAEK